MAFRWNKDEAKDEIPRTGRKAVHRETPANEAPFASGRNYMEKVKPVKPTVRKDQLPQDNPKEAALKFQNRNRGSGNFLKLGGDSDRFLKQKNYGDFASVGNRATKKVTLEKSNNAASAAKLYKDRNRGENNILVANIEHGKEIQFAKPGDFVTKTSNSVQSATNDRHLSAGAVAKANKKKHFGSNNILQQGENIGGTQLKEQRSCKYGGLAAEGNKSMKGVTMQKQLTALEAAQKNKNRNTIGASIFN
jgi:hypothetical protein